MATGSASGHIGLWDLEKRKLRSQMREAHGTAVTGMQCLPSEPLMVTSAADNTLKVCHILVVPWFSCNECSFSYIYPNHVRW